MVIILSLGTHTWYFYKN